MESACNRALIRHTHKLLSFVLSAFLVGAASLHAVVINEVHYNPNEGSTLEFVELYNPDSAEVSVAGWSFSSGIAFFFPEGATIAASGYLLVCKDRAAVAGHFQVPLAELHGDYEGKLDNGGEPLALVDARGAVVDAFRYDDDPPWGSEADGDGASLQRICVSFSAQHPGNWAAGPEATPTPLAENTTSECPPPELPAPPIAINEIYYHPVGDTDTTEEFIELINNTGSPVNLRGYSFEDGVTFKFEADTNLEPGGLVAVCRDVDHFRGKYGVENAVGNFTGQLSNDGERITLVDGSGAFVDSVSYRDTGGWAVAADGLRHSLEKLIPTAVSDDPASWRDSTVKDLTQWESVTVTGIATSTTRMFMYLDEVGEFLIDNMVLEKLDEPGVNVIENGAFDTSTEPWEKNGNHAETRWEADVGPDGSGAMHMVATGRGSGSRHGLRFNFPDDSIVRNAEYRLSFDYLHLSGTVGLTVRISGSSPVRGVYFKLGEGAIFSPGEENSRQPDHLPPYVEHLGRFPREPQSTDTVWITALARGPQPIASVKLNYSVDNEEQVTSLDMLDDGSHQDGSAGDGVYGVEIPAQVHNTIMIFKIVAEDAAGSTRQSPLETDTTGFHGYYVNDNQVDSPFPVYTVLWNHKTPIAPRAVRNRLSSCIVYQPASFSYQGDLYYNLLGLRRRGGSVCGDGNVIKPYMKVKFNRGRLFENQRKINLQSQYTDKSLIRELMAWEAFDEVASPWCREYYIRLHLNGEYFGLYCVLEHPDARYLERNRLNPAGNLYKATASREEANGTYEKKTNELDPSGMTDLREFLNEMHSTPRRELVDFFTTNFDPDRMIDYQLVQTLTNNADYPHRNHYLYHDLEKDKWMPLTWDMDLTFGKRWDGGNGGVLHDRMHTPGNNPWYTTTVDGGLGNHLNDKFFSQAGTWYRRAYIVRLWRALEEKYTVEFYQNKVDFLHDLLIDEQAEDIEVWGRSRTWPDDRNAPPEFEPNLERVMNHIKTRRSYLLNYLRTHRTTRFEGTDRMKITEVMYNPAGPDEESEWLELWNSTGKEIDVSGWTIEGIGFEFPEGTKAAENAVFVVARNVAAFRKKYGNGVRVLGGYPARLDNNGEILRLKDAGPEYPATVDLLRYGTDGDWPQGADGRGYSIELTEVADNRDNDLGFYWRRSRSVGGSPGEIDGITAPQSFYRRGDVNADGTIGITDAIAVLGFLFLGMDDPACGAAMDVDADLAVGLADAVFLLGYLFDGDDVSLPSPGPKDCDPVSVDACGVSNCEG